MGRINFSAKKGKIQYSIAKPKAKVSIQYPEGPPDVERDSEIELTELQKSFRAKSAKEAQTKATNIDTENFICIVFQSQAQRNEFLQQLQITSKDNQYINGLQLIKALQLRIDALEKNSPGMFKVNKEIANLAIDN